AFSCPHEETPLPYRDRAVAIYPLLNLTQARSIPSDREARHHPWDRLQAIGECADVVDVLDERRRGLLGDLEPGSRELRRHPRRPAVCVRPWFGRDAEQRAVVVVVAGVDLLRDEPAATHEDAGDLRRLEAFVAIDDD